MRFILLLPLICLTAACGEQPAQGPVPERIVPTESDIAFASSAQPTNEHIAGIYNRSCKNCHAIAGVNAPLTGHVEAWEDRLAERGREGLLHSTKFGYRYMPARGLCRNCTDEEFLALIDFMLTPPG